MQIVVLLVYFSNNAWLTMLAISAITVIPAYFASTAYLFKICINKEYDKYASKGRIAALISSGIGAIKLFHKSKNDLSFADYLYPITLNIHA